MEILETDEFRGKALSIELRLRETETRHMSVTVYTANE